MDLRLAACADLPWPDKPIAWRASRIHEMGIGVGPWNWLDGCPDALDGTPKPIRPIATHEAARTERKIGTRAPGLDPGSQTVRASNCDDHRREQLLMATGARARLFPGSEACLAPRTDADAADNPECLTRAHGSRSSAVAWLPSNRRLQRASPVSMSRSWQPGAARAMPVAKNIRVLDRPFERDSSVDSQVLANPSQDLK
ncbi:MAG: hypothetical protein OXH79_19430 [Boseongicola sp.]|nr:hypothetical protein [Boseongicola sp.]